MCVCVWVFLHQAEFGQANKPKKLYGYASSKTVIVQISAQKEISVFRSNINRSWFWFFLLIKDGFALYIINDSNIIEDKGGGL